MTRRCFLPRDAAALAVGAEAVAQALREAAAAAGETLELVRTGSRGMLWLEPLLEVEVDGVRHGYGPLRADDVPALAAAGLFGATPPAHPKAIGPVEAHPWLTRQQRLIFARCGRTDPLSLEEYDAAGGWAGLSRARRLGPAATLAEVTVSGLRGRGGAGFPAGRKWQTAREAPGEPKYIVCNADEGDSGSFADRMLMEGDPYLLLEGMAIAALAVGATRGFIYVRSEYPHAIATLREAIGRCAGMLGNFRVELRVGAGAYVCGEETALLESLEGKRGLVRAKPPLPAVQGLFGRPTVVNNVLTLAAVPWVLAQGGAAYAALGHGRSRGTIPVQLAGNVRHGGLFEVPFGLTLGELVMEIGGGTASGRPVKAVQVGGPLGAYLPPAQFDTPFDYEAFAARDALLGHAGIVVFDDTADMARLARFAFEFCAAESCGKCTPCRLGAVRGAETLAQVIEGVAPEANLALLEALCETMRFGSLCALGGFTPYPVSSAMRHFPEDFRRPARPAEQG